MAEQKGILSELKPSTVEAEQKYIGYLLNNSAIESYIIPVNNYSEASHRIIIESLMEMQTNNLQMDYDSLLLLCKKKYDSFDSEVLYKIYNQSKNFENIELFKKEIREGHLKRKAIDSFEDILVSVTDKNFFDLNKFQNSLQDLLQNIYSIEDSELLDGKGLKEEYQKIIENRKKGVHQKSLGYEELHKIIKKPAAPGEMTGCIAQKGGGKSAFAKNIEQKLLNKGVCVVSINLEMTLESNVDRFQCMKTGFPLDMILSQNQDKGIENQIKLALNSWDNIPNYLYYTEPSLTLNQLDGLCFKSKQIFRSRGMLPEDEYIFVVIDLASMINELSNVKSAYEIESAVNKLHTIIRKHKCHALLILQANENKFRMGKIFKNPDELDFYKVGLEDIKGAAAWSERCRVIMTLTRPVQMKKRFFPEQNDTWDLETDVINLNVVKQNDGPEGFCQFVMNPNFRIYPYVKEALEEM